MYIIMIRFSYLLLSSPVVVAVGCNGVTFIELVLIVLTSLEEDDLLLLPVSCRVVLLNGVSLSLPFSTARR